MAFVTCPCISLLLCCQDPYAQAAVSNAKSCQNQSSLPLGKTEVIKINNNLSGTHDTVNNFKSDLTMLSAAWPQRLWKLEETSFK